MSLPFELRPYQRDCLAQLPDKGAGLVVMATGLGKTATFSQIPRRGRMLILSHRDELVHQPAKYFDCPVGFEAGPETSHGEQVISASVQSLYRRLSKFPSDYFDIIITDEAHHATAPTYRKIYNHFKPRLHLGFTATPNRQDQVGLDSIYTDVVYALDLEWGVKNKYLCDIHCYRAKLDISLAGIACRMGDFEQRALERQMNIERANQGIAEAYRTLAKGQTLIFAVSIAHAQALAQLIPDAAVVVGGEDRSETIRRFLNGELKCIINCLVFTEGTDLPNVETIIIARPTKNISLYTQMVGRGMRLYPGKEYLTLIDCVGVSNLDICTAPSLLGLPVMDPPPGHPHLYEGDLFGIKNKVKLVMDTVDSWINGIEYVDIWSKDEGYNTHSMHWRRSPTGELYLSAPKIVLPAPDVLGYTVYLGERMKVQQALDEVQRFVQTQHKELRPLWDERQVKRWDKSPATAKQVQAILNIAGRNKKIKSWITPQKLNSLSKYGAAEIIGRAMMKCPVKPNAASTSSDNSTIC